MRVREFHLKRADVVSVSRLFAGAARFRCGPARPGFHWGPPQVAQLLVDLETAARDSVDEEDVSEERFYLGVITISPIGKGIATLLDGQQRLVTLAMFLAFARDRLPNNGERNRVDRMLMRRAFGRAPEPRMRLAPEDHAWFAHFILPPGATKRLPPTAPLGSPRELLLAARFMEHAFNSYSTADLRNIIDFLMHHTAVVRSLAEQRPVYPAAPALPAPPRQNPVWNDDPFPAPSGPRYNVAAE
ncbi:MAG: DUF262 domain-containing protein [Burkholderiales bacterium]|nr:MAG: DUF262 domain-containing protein [Burkholderiales bacterium]